MPHGGDDKAQGLAASYVPLPPILLLLLLIIKLRARKLFWYYYSGCFGPLRPLHPPQQHERQRQHTDLVAPLLLSTHICVGHLVLTPGAHREERGEEKGGLQGKLTVNGQHLFALGEASSMGRWGGWEFNCTGKHKT